MRCLSELVASFQFLKVYSFGEVSMGIFMKTFLGVLVFAGVVLSLLACIILLTVGRGRNKVNQLLAIVLFTVGLEAFFKLLFLAEVMTEISTYFKFVVPLFYLIPPSIYIYTSVVLYGSVNKKNLWLHLLPSVLIAIFALLIFFFLDVKGYEHVQFVANDRQSVFTIDSGAIFLWLHFVTRIAQGFVYLFFQCRLIFRFYREVMSDTDQFRKIFRWVCVLTVMEITLYIFMLLFYILVILGFGNLGQTVNMLFLVLCVCYVIFPFYLYLSPSLLYGGGEGRMMLDQEIETVAQGVVENTVPVEFEKAANPQHKNTENPVSSVKVVISPYTADNLDEFRERFEKVVIGTGLFRQQGLKVQDVSGLCDIPPRALSYLLATVYKKGFNDFINECRIDYVADRLIKDDWKDLTLEGLGFEAGFSSRTTFFIAFKKNKQVNPTQYLHMHNLRLLK